MGTNTRNAFRPISKLQIFLITLGLAITSQTHALKNPAAVYCEALGYEYQIVGTKKGEKGICVINPETKVDAWEFLQGKVKQEHNACGLLRGTTKIVRDPQTCKSIYSKECAVCILRNKIQTREVTRLLDLSFGKTECGDGTYAIPENATPRPHDCTSGAKNGIYDPDCTRKINPE
ncbi:MAG: DUF333 domain-containing protein [Xanthomonadales bacterium]|nr:DUF333 domain-containing protein [Xanthomonadales bacterium]